ncbi:hypothetical protein M0R45_005866 [Rubus argutus]|uniref:Zinc finger PHD-type domain-containing protein n=1 Tax=Rubus argutus TaxID=59490 RepID=A0AAW1YNX2_RUBAR
MVVNERPQKRMKRRITADLNDFFTFPSAAAVATGPFRTAVRDFSPTMRWVGDVDQLPTATTDGPDSFPPPIVCLDIVEEDVARSRNVYCDQCRVVGWSGHPVCGKRYHFIIKADGNSIGGYHKPCMCCGDVVHIYESKCKSCNLDCKVNGREGGSRMLSGCHIMDFWDRLCKVLGVRMVSVMDVSKKYGLEYRLLHAIIKGHPWYGDWGYEFATGSFALTLDAYKLAVEKLSTLPLSTFLAQGRHSSSFIHDIILRYQSLSERELLNIKDLFGFLISLVHNASKCSTRVDDAMSKKRRASTSGVLYSWTKSDVDCVEEAMVKVLRAVSGSNWVNQRNLRKVVYKGQPSDLLDYCLNELGGKVVADGIFVNSRRNSDGDFEYRLEAGNGASNGTTPCSGSSMSRRLSEENLLLDLRFLYESMLHPQTMMKDVPQETRDLAISCAEKLLDCKQFVKDYKPERMPINDPSVTCILCRVEFTDESDDIKSFSRCIFDVKRFQAEELVDYGGVDESTQVKNLLGSAEYVRMRGRCNAKSGWSKYSMERGIERWTVDCSCGAKDDDGERMLACDVCGVWRHTRCSGIPDSDSVPANFVCQGCKSSVSVANTGGPCKDEVVANVAGDSCSFGNSLTAPPDIR